MNRAWVALLFVVGCSSPSARGAATASPARVPSVKRLASYRAIECRDSSGKTFAHESEVWLGIDGEGARILVHAVPGYDALVVRNRFEERGEQVYQAILSDGTRKPVLMDFRLPASGPGRMAAARWFAEAEAPESSPRGRVVAISFACRLEPEGSS